MANRKFGWAGSGHWVYAINEEDALRIANQFKIGNPMGGKAKRTLALWQPPFYQNRNYRGKVWAEIGNKLIGFETPLNDQLPVN